MPHPVYATAVSTQPYVVRTSVMPSTRPAAVGGGAPPPRAAVSPSSRFGPPPLAQSAPSSARSSLNGRKATPMASLGARSESPRGPTVVTAGVLQHSASGTHLQFWSTNSATLRVSNSPPRASVGTSTSVATASPQHTVAPAGSSIISSARAPRLQSLTSATIAPSGLVTARSRSPATSSGLFRTSPSGAQTQRGAPAGTVGALSGSDRGLVMLTAREPRGPSPPQRVAMLGHSCQSNLAAWPASAKTSTATAPTLSASTSVLESPRRKQDHFSILVTSGDYSRLVSPLSTSSSAPSAQAPVCNEVDIDKVIVNEDDAPHPLTRSASSSTTQGSAQTTTLTAAQGLASASSITGLASTGGQNEAILQQQRQQQGQSSASSQRLRAATLTVPSIVAAANQHGAVPRLGNVTRSASRLKEVPQESQEQESSSRGNSESPQAKTASVPAGITPSQIAANSTRADSPQANIKSVPAGIVPSRVAALEETLSASSSSLAVASAHDGTYGSSSSSTFTASEKCLFALGQVPGADAGTGASITAAGDNEHGCREPLAQAYAVRHEMDRIRQEACEWHQMRQQREVKLTACLQEALNAKSDMEQRLAAMEARLNEVSSAAEAAASQRWASQLDQANQDKSFYKQRWEGAQSRLQAAELEREHLRLQLQAQGSTR